MSLLKLDPAFLLEGMTLLLMALGLSTIGLTLVFSASKERARAVGRRIELVREQPPARGGKGQSAAKRPASRAHTEAPQSLTEAEHRQIMHFFRRFGSRPESALAHFNALRLLLPLVLAGSTLPLLLGPLAALPAAGLLVAAVAGAAGYYLPMTMVRRGVKRRSRVVAAGLPDALELLAVCIEAGLSLENGLQRVSAELRRSAPELADELALTWAEINILPNRDQALLNLAERVNVPSVRSVVTTLSQALRYGTPLARSLRVVAADVRSDQLTLMEEKANRLPALMTIPVMLFIMPTLFLIIGGPAALKLMEIFWGK